MAGAGTGNTYCIQPVLLLQRCCNGRVVHGHAEHPPTRIAARQQIVKDQGLVCPVEGTEAEVYYARLRLVPVTRYVDTTSH